MGKRDELIEKYAIVLRTKCGMEPDMALLTQVTLGCGPAIYSAEFNTISSENPDDIEAIKSNFLMKKLGLRDSAELTDAIRAVLEVYGRREPLKYRAVVYYMLTKYFGKESHYQ